MRNYILFGLLLVVCSFVACNPNRREMPITTSSEEARELFIEARDLYENFEPIQADSLLYQALQLDPDFALAHLSLFNHDGLPDAYQLIDQVSQGEAYMIKAWSAHLARDTLLCDRMIDSLLTLHPKDKHCLYFVGVIWGSRDVQKAIYYFNQAIKIDKYYAAAHVRNGGLLLVTKQYEEADEHFKRYLDLMPPSGGPLDSYGALLQLMGQEDKALKQYLRSIQVDPGYSNSYYKVIVIYDRRGEFNQALKYCDMYYEIGQHFRLTESALLWKACILLKLDNLPAALNVIDQLLQSARERGDHRKEISIIHFKGWVALSANQTNLAQSVFLNNLEIVNQNRIQEIEGYFMMRTYGCLSILYGQMKDTLEALDYLNMAREVYLSRKDSSDRHHMNLYEGVYDYHTGNYELAEAHLYQPGNTYSVGCQYYLAETYRMLDDREQAKYYYGLASESNNPWWAGLFYNKCKERLAELDQ